MPSKAHQVKSKKIVVTAKRAKQHGPVVLNTYVYDLFNAKLAVATASNPWWKTELNTTKSAEDPQVEQASFIIEQNSPVYHYFFVAILNSPLAAQDELIVDIMAEITVNKENERASIAQYAVKGDGKSTQFCIGYMIRDVQTDEHVLFRNGFSVSGEAQIANHLPVKPSKIAVRVLKANQLYPMDYTGTSVSVKQYQQ